MSRRPSYVTLKFEKHAINVLRYMFGSVYLTFVYLPPSNSTFCKVNGKEIIEKLEKQIDFFSCKGKVIICGDFNARVGELVDGLEKEEESHVPLPNDGSYEYILPHIVELLSEKILQLMIQA